MADDDLTGLKQAVAALPDNLPLRRQLAGALESAGAPEAALAEWAALLERAPGDASGLVGAARCLYEIGRYGEALEHYDRAVEREVRVADAGLREKIVRAQA